MEACVTHRLVIAVDPGLTGAIAALADGEYSRVIDMPVVAKRNGANEVDPALLAQAIREIRGKHLGAYCVAVLEQVGAMPSIPGPGGVRRGMGATSAFGFGDTFGTIRGVIATLGIPVVRVVPQTWKRHFGLRGADKNASRAMALQRCPAAAGALTRVKDNGRAEAILLALYGADTEVIPAAPTTLETVQ